MATGRRALIDYTCIAHAAIRTGFRRRECLDYMEATEIKYNQRWGREIKSGFYHLQKKKASKTKEKEIKRHIVLTAKRAANQPQANPPSVPAPPPMMITSPHTQTPRTPVAFSLPACSGRVVFLQRKCFSVRSAPVGSWCGRPLGAAAAAARVDGRAGWLAERTARLPSQLLSCRLCSLRRLNLHCGGWSCDALWLVRLARLSDA